MAGINLKNKIYVIYKWIYKKELIIMKKHFLNILS